METKSSKGLEPTGGSRLRSAILAAFAYAARSKKGGDDRSTESQLAAIAERIAPLPIAAFETDNGYSGSKRNRGPGLERLIEAAVVHVRDHGEAELWVFHSSRLARGSGRKDEARSLQELLVYLRREGVAVRSVEDDEFTTNPMLWGIASELAAKYADDLSAHVRRGLRERRTSGKPMGAIPEGYTVQTSIDTNGKAVTTRVIDPERMKNIVMRSMEMVESGSTFGAVSRRLNADGLATRRGKQWRARAIREIVLNEDYTGATGYPQAIDRARWERIVASVKRLDPVAVQSRRKGPTPSENYLLRGIASCGRCGAPLWTRRYKRVPDERAYTCSAVRQATGTCDAKPIPAVPVEKAVIDRLDHFLTDVEGWIRSRAEKADQDRELFAKTIAAQRTKLRNLNVKIEKARDAWERLLGEDDDAADAALRGATRLEGDAAHLQGAIAAADAQLAEWPTAEVDAALDFYSELKSAISGRVQAAKGFDELHAALRSILAGAAFSVSEDGAFIAGTFELAGPDVTDGKLPMLVHAGWRVDDVFAGVDAGPIIVTRRHDGEVVTGAWADRDARPR